MSAKTTIDCDACGKDVQYTGNCVDYRLALISETKTPWYVREGKQSGAVTAMMIYPPIPETKHFCSLACLRMWLVPD